MSSKNSRTHGSPAEMSRKPDANAPTRLFAVPPRLSESRATASCPSGAVPSSEAATQTRARKLPPPRRVRPATPTIEVNEPMLIYLDSPPLHRVGDARAAHSMRPKTTDTAPSVAPVPIIAISPQRPLAHSPARPLAAGLLRAYDHERRRPANWTTAKTIDSSLSPFPVPNGSARPAAGGDEPVRAARQSRPASPPRALAHLRLSRAATKKILALFVAAAVLVALGTVAGQTIARVVADRDAASAVAESAVKETSAAATSGAATSAAATTAETTQPSPESTPRSRMVDAPVARAAPARQLAASAPRSSPSAEATLARQAVDALLAGDRARALLLYRELSRAAPGREDYRKAVRLLTPTPAPAPSTHTASPIVP